MCPSVQQLCTSHVQIINCDPQTLSSSSPEDCHPRPAPSSRCSRGSSRPSERRQRAVSAPLSGCCHPQASPSPQWTPSVPRSGCPGAAIARPTGWRRWEDRWLLHLRRFGTWRSGFVRKAAIPFFPLSGHVSHRVPPSRAEEVRQAVLCFRSSAHRLLPGVPAFLRRGHRRA